MRLDFVYGNKQKKHLVESDFADDIYDVMISFFEDHNAFPHVLTLDIWENVALIGMPNTPEHFRIEGIEEDQVCELKELIANYTR